MCAHVAEEFFHTERKTAGLQWCVWEGNLFDPRDKFPKSIWHKQSAYAHCLTSATWANSCQEGLMPAGYWCMLGKVPDSTACFSIWHSWPGMTAAAPERKRDRECVVGTSRCRLSVFRVRFRGMFPVSDTERQQKWARVGLNKARFVWESQRQRESQLTVPIIPLKYPPRWQRGTHTGAEREREWAREVGGIFCFLMKGERERECSYLLIGLQEM